MKLENIYEGLVVKSYRQLCELLEIEITGGNSKKAQLKELERFVKYHKEGNKFIIDEDKLYDAIQLLAKYGLIDEEGVDM